MKLNDRAYSFLLVDHPILSFFVLVGALFSVAIFHDTVRENNVKTRIRTLQMDDGITCFVLEDSISCVREK